MELKLLERVLISQNTQVCVSHLEALTVDKYRRWGEVTVALGFIICVHVQNKMLPGHLKISVSVTLSAASN